MQNKMAMQSYVRHSFNHLMPYLKCRKWNSMLEIVNHVTMKLLSSIQFLQNRQRKKSKVIYSVNIPSGAGEVYKPNE